MKKYIVYTVLAVFVGVLAANAQTYSFSNNLTLGSTGTDVVSLQNFLIASGFDIPAVSGGLSGKGYFGTQTKAALIRYQNFIGVPALGFFGPLTRQRINNGGNYNNGNGYSNGNSGNIGGGTNTNSNIIRVTSPNGGETLTRGYSQNITWWVNPLIPNITGDILLTPSFPACAQSSQTNPVVCTVAVRAPYLIAKNINLNYGSYNWNVGTNTDLSGSSISAPDGQYRIQICTSDGSQCDTSDNYFNISSPYNPGIGTPVISGIDSPVSLSVGQNGTWTVHATDPKNGSLSYSVDWGDQAGYTGGINTGVASLNQSNQIASFTHTYSNVGTYTVRFTVTNNSGQTAQSSVTVNVAGSNSSAGPLRVTSPNGGEVWSKNTTQLITWTSPYYFRATYADLRIIRKYVCTGQICPAIAYAPYTIATNIPINQNSYSWNVGSVTQYMPTGSNGYSAMPAASILPDDSQYQIEICESGTTNCDTSDRVFTITSWYR